MKTISYDLDSLACLKNEINLSESKHTKRGLFLFLSATHLYSL